MFYRINYTAHDLSLNYYLKSLRRYERKIQVGTFFSVTKLVELTGQSNGLSAKWHR